MVFEDGFAAYTGAIAAILVAGVSGVFWLIRQAVAKKIDEAKLELSQRINVEADNIVKQFGESLQAIRQKMTDMELWNRDNFVSGKAFEIIVTDMRDSWRRLEDKMDRRFDALDRKLMKMENNNGGH